MRGIGYVIERIGLGRIGAFILLIALLAIRIADPSIVQTLRNQSFDIYQRWKPRVYTRQPVAILDIDEASIQKLGQWPWPRTRMAELVDKLKAQNVAAVAFDIVFAESDRLSPDVVAADNPTLSEDIKTALKALPSNDDVFANAISQARIVVGQTTVRSITDTRINEDDPVKDVPHAFIGDDPLPFLPQYPAMVQNRPELEKAASGHGVFTVQPDVDGVFRRIPLVLMVQDKIRLSLSAELLRVATGGRAFALKANAAGVEGIKIARTFVATAPDGSVWPYFSKSVPSRFVSALDLVEGKVPPNRLRGHLVLIGTSAIGLEDFRATPMASLMAGVEIHAQVIENILSGQMLVRPNYVIAIELLTILVVGLLAIILVPMLGATRSFIFAAFLIPAYVAFSYFAFDQYRMLIDPVFPAGSAIAIFILLATHNYLQEEQKRKQIRGAFGQYVSPDLVSQLSDNPDELVLGGETRELSVLFSDVRGFTAISESYKTNPQGLTELMNRFLTVLSNGILRYEGTIDKFMGDAVMAFWNAPLKHETHALAACNAALDMISDVATLNEETLREFESLGSDEERKANPHNAINVGIGINTGSCVVGNMGSHNRFDYTALGDTVNLASRLEGQSKPYGVKIILGQGTAQQVLDEMATLEIDLIRVKGKQDPERIYGLFGREDMLNSPDFQKLQELNQSMLNNFREQDWESAAALVELMHEQSDKVGIDIEEFLFIYESRITEFEANPPGPNWDGVYTATTK